MKPFDQEHNRATRERLAEMGIEMTPDELKQEQKVMMQRVRRNLEAAGFELPEDDEQLFLLMVHALRARM